MCEEAAAAAAGVGRQHSSTWPWFGADGKWPLVWLHSFVDCFGRCKMRGRGPEVLQWRVEVFCKFSSQFVSGNFSKVRVDYDL